MKKHAVIICLLSLLSASISAHNPKEETKVTTFGYKADIDSTRIYEVLHHNAPEDFKTNGVPAVAVVGKNGKFILGVGGYVKAVVGWDFGHPIDNADEFITSQIPMHPMEGNGSRFNLSAKQTHLFINFVALPGTGNEIGAFVSANLLDGYVPTLQYAYLKYRGLKAGFDNTLFSDPACGAPAVDYEGPCSNTASPVAGVSYIWEPAPHGRWQAGIGLELPHASFTTVEGKTGFVYQRFPDIPMAGQFSWDEGNSWVRLSAVARTLTYRNLESRANHNKPGYGFQLSGGWNFLEGLTLFYQGIWGKGIASLMQDTADEGLDLTPTADGKSLAPTMAWGGFVSLQYDISERFCASATYSQLRSYAPRYAGGDTPWSDLCKYTQYASCNLFCHLTSYFDIGIEYIWGRRTNFDGLKCADNRLQAAFQLSF